MNRSRYNPAARGMRRADAEVCQIIVRWDFDARRWKHSAGIVLTSREATVLANLATGATNDEIAKATSCAFSTVEKNVASLKNKFRVSGDAVVSRRQLVKIAIDLF